MGGGGGGTTSNLPGFVLSSCTVKIEKGRGIKPRHFGEFVARKAQEGNLENVYCRENWFLPLLLFVLESVFSSQVFI